MKEELQEKIDKRAEELLKEYLTDNNMLLEAIREGLSEDATYAHLIKPMLMYERTYDFFNLTATLLKKYLREIAIETAENELT